jgi:transposase
MSQTTSGSSQEDAPIKYVCGIDVGSQSCAGCVCRPDKSVVVKPVTFAKVLLSGEARAGYVPSEQITTYRELVRLHTRLSDEAASYQNEIQALVVVLFPEFTQVFADPCLPSALAVLKAYPSAQDVAAAGVEPITQLLRTQTPAHFGRPTARKLVAVAHESVSSNRALSGRSTSLRVLCDQLEHTQANLARLQAELEQLIARDPGVKGLKQIPEFGPKTVAVLRAELGEVNRFSRTDEVIAYGGMDVEIKESGQWKGKAKLSKRGSGLVRRVLALFGDPKYSPGGVPFWCLLPSFGAAGPQERLRLDGCDAQNAGGCCSSAQTCGGKL